MGKLNALVVKGISKPGLHADGDGLYLAVKGTSKSWVFRYALRGKRREMGLGPLALVSLAEARNQAFEKRRLLQSGLDPLEARKKEQLETRLKAARAISFRDCALEYIEAQSPSWSSPRQAPIWKSSLERMVFPILGDAPVSEVSRELIVQALKPHWYVKPDTSRRVLNRVERILGYAGVVGYRSGENPARWRDGLDHVFPTRTKFAKISHMPSLPRDELPAFYKDLQKAPKGIERALSFLILTAARTQEVVGCRWVEFDFVARTWTIPPERMKARREHRIPLSDAALGILREQRALSINHFVFPGRIGGRHLSNMTMLMRMRRMGRTEVPHGFRSTFRDWASECTDYPGEVAEMALAHAVKDKTEAAYRRGDLFEKRRELMNDWARFCTSAIDARPAPENGT